MPREFPGSLCAVKSFEPLAQSPGRKVKGQSQPEIVAEIRLSNCLHMVPGRPFYL